MSKDLENFFNKTKKEVDKEIMKVIPKKATKNWLKELSLKEINLNSLKEEVIKPTWDFIERGGKRWRPALLILCCKALNGSKKKALTLSPLPELIHNGTIIIDDIEDNALMRRNKKALHLIYGIDTAINTGNLLYFIGLNLLKKNKAKLKEKQLNEIFEAYTNELINVSLGQALDIRWHKSNYIPTEKEYLKMVALKTGALARFAAILGAIIAEAKEKEIKAISDFAESIGIAFQLQDDILNIVPAKKEWGKELGEDISEGKKSLLVIKALKELNKKEGNELKRILKEKTKNKKKIIKAINLIKKTNAINYSQKKAEKIVLNAWKKIEKILPETKEKRILKELAEFVVKRKI